MALFRRKQDTESPLSHVIDLTNQPVESTPGLVWGMPSSCPNCDDFGYLDHIDLINEVMLQHCPTCWHRWEISKTETEEPATA
jgi:hypothetical protein